MSPDARGGKSLSLMSGGERTFIDACLTRASGLIVPDPGVLCRIASQVPAAQLQGRRRRPERELGISGFSA